MLGGEVLDVEVVPVRVVRADGGAADGVEVDAVKLADDDSGDLIVRLHEAIGNRVRVSIDTPGVASPRRGTATSSRSRTVEKRSATASSS